MGKIIILLVSLAVCSCIHPLGKEETLNTEMHPDVSQWKSWTSTMRSGYYMIQQRDAQDSVKRYVIFVPEYCKSVIYKQVMRRLFKTARGEYREVNVVSQDPGIWRSMSESDAELHEIIMFLNEALPQRVKEDNGILYIQALSGEQYAYSEFQMDTTTWSLLDNNWYLRKHVQTDVQ